MTPTDQFLAARPIVERNARALHSVLGLELDDARQAGYEALWKACNEGPPKGDGYLVIRVRGAIIDAGRSWYGRDRKRRPRIVSTEDVLPSALPHFTPEPPSYGKRLTEVAQAVRSLPERTQEVFTERVLAETPARELAARFQISMPRISQIMSKAIKKIRERVG